MKTAKMLLFDKGVSLSEVINVMLGQRQIGGNIVDASAD